ncbi:MAG: sialate O-acetylesterase [Solidesulfovibrio sp.]|uniref:sialate O-acetylesterase n=1 Tax=Solidesulfovibrio sp. TaxID=2910990 RepID=UPI003158CF4B
MLSRADFFSGRGERPFTPQRPRWAGLVAGLSVLAAFTVEFSPAAPPRPTPQEVRAKYAAVTPDVGSRGELAVYAGPTDEPAVDCGGLLGPRTMIALVLGQSNASNTVDPGYAATRPVFAYADGQCHRVRDAVPGATGDKGSSWARLGDRVIDSGLYDAVIFADIARGGSSILHWGPGGQLNALLTETLDTLAAKDMRPTHVLFHQGEADCARGLSREEYGVMLEAVLGDIRAHGGQDSDIFVSRASLYLDPACGDRHDPACYAACPAITAAQTQAADPDRRVYRGPNTDLLVPWFDRNDGYHFTAQAADRFAEAWMPLLARDGRKARPSN